MLEKSDLQQIGLLLDEKLEPFKQRLNALEIEINDVKIIVKRIDKRSDEDIQSVYKEIEKLKKKILDLEKELKILQTRKV